MTLPRVTLPRIHCLGSLDTLTTASGGSGDKYNQQPSKSETKNMTPMVSTLTMMYIIAYRTTVSKEYAVGVVAGFPRHTTSSAFRPFPYAELRYWIVAHPVVHVYDAWRIIRYKMSCRAVLVSSHNPENASRVCTWRATAAKLCRYLLECINIIVPMGCYAPGQGVSVGAHEQVGVQEQAGVQQQASRGRQGRVHTMDASPYRHTLKASRPAYNQLQEAPLSGRAALNEKP